MKNEEVVSQIKLFAALLDLHFENEFKIRSYQNAAFQLDKITSPIIELNQEQFESLYKLGKSVSAKVLELARNGSFSELEELLNQTPSGVLEMLSIKGLGPKKVRNIWKDLGIESIEELLNACYQDKIAQLSGFGEKTQKLIIDSIHFQKAQSGKLWMDDAESISEKIIEKLRAIHFKMVEPTGQVRRKSETVDKIEILVGYSDYGVAVDELKKLDFWKYDPSNSGPVVLSGKLNKEHVDLEFNLCPQDRFYNHLLITSSCNNHLNYVLGNLTLRNLIINSEIESESQFYNGNNMPFIPAELREGFVEFELIKKNEFKNLVDYSDLKGILHNHSIWSDGKNSIKEMANACKEMGYEYFGISDHSKSATYANGLSESDVLNQIEEIDQLNIELNPFKIFKGIESDILSNGDLDYSDELLQRFDFVVASIHSGLKMDIEKATKRLIKAIENPHTTILGHPTGRLLLNREGYPIDYKKIIEACAANGVSIEINADPWRLDLSWKWIPYCMEKEVMICINPDAHNVDGLNNMKYGYFIGRKGGLLKEKTLNALSSNQLTNYFHQKKSKK